MRKHIILGYGHKHVHKHDLHKHLFGHHRKGEGAIMKDYSLERHHSKHTGHCRAVTKVKPLRFKF